MPKRASPKGRGRVRDRAKEMFRGAILDAAEEAFAASGFHGAHMQEIARRAGLAVGTIYNHFGQKEDVLLALLEQRVAELHDALAPAKGDPAGFADKLTARLERVLAFRERHAAFFALAVELGLIGDATSAARQLLGGRSLPQTGRLQAVWLDLVDEGLAAGALAPLDRELLASLLKNTLRSVVRWTRDRGPRPAGDIARLIVDLFLRGYGTARAPEQAKARPARRSRSKPG